ncbi:unnamed protein product [Rotaria magnacalcarata]|uniref:Uncharacterized protein n=1 Tax=Rotaria magnacalcarata TaxID=392030 RepID=A0A816M4Y4_9BILA|nr:unnamed protein product [Rotaria magnacalcarata]CAF3921413.1 unnamed protein product [Rotaria magnacalcarata]
MVIRMRESDRKQDDIEMTTDSFILNSLLCHPNVPTDRNVRRCEILFSSMHNKHIGYHIKWSCLLNSVVFSVKEYEIAITIRMLWGEGGQNEKRIN